MDTPNQSQPKGISKPVVWALLIVVILAVALGLYYYMQKTEPSTNTNVVLNANRVANANTANTNILGNQNTNSGTNINSSANTNTSNTNNSSSDWVNYTDATSGLLIQYPESWVTVDTSYASRGFRPSSSQPGQTDWAAIYVNFRSNQRNLGIQEFYSEATNFPNLYDKATSYESRTINNIQVIYFPTIPGAVANSVLVTSSGSWIIELQMHKDQIGVIENIEEIFFDMIATVQ